MKVYNDAQAMIDELAKTNNLKANGIVGFFRANSINDEDIIIYEGDTNCELARFCGLRQQAQKEAQDNSPYYSLADLIAPVNSGHEDYIGLFVVTAGHGCDKLCEQYQKNNDVYNDILVKAVADRLAEAFAEELHERVRKELWAYAPNESLETGELLKVRYQGIRPAPGYPSQPDHTEKETFWRIMNVLDETGIKLTDSLAIWPAASTCGIYFAHPKANYFAVGKIQKDQVVSYAKRKEMPLETMERWLAPILAYD